MINVRNLSRIAVAVIALHGSASHAAIKGAFVESVLPSKPYTGHMTVLNATNSIGLGSSTLSLGITSITLTNFDTSPQQVFIFVPLYSGTCSGTIIGGSSPQMTFYVQPQQTLHLTYPSPLVINPYSGCTAIAAEVTTLLHGGSVTMDVNGFAN